MTVRAADRGGPPSATVARTVRSRLPQWERSRTSNGLTVATWPSRDAPVVRLRMIFSAGAHYEPEPAAGLASLVAPLLRAANQRHSLEALEGLVESLGTDIVAEAEWEVASLTLDVLAKDAVAALDLLLDVAACPAFPQSALDMLRSRRVAELRQQARDPALLALDALFRALFPHGRYGVPLLGTVDSISAVSRDDIAGFHARQYAPRVSSLIVTGDADPHAVRQRAERYALPNDEAADRPARSVDAHDVVPPSRLLLVDCPHARHTEIRVGQRSVDQAHPDALALQVLSMLLGGTSFSRLGRRLRHESGYCYYVHSRFVLRRRGGAFLVSTSVPTDRAGRAVSDILSELARLRDEPASGDDLTAARGQLEAVLFQSWGCLTGQADRLTYMLASDLDDDYAERCFEAVRAMTTDRFIELAQTYLPDERMVVVAAGPAARLRPQLEHLGTPIEV